MDKERAIKEIVAYCRGQIADFDERADLATNKMYRESIPIENADYALADEVVDCIRDWYSDNECESLADEITTEDIVMNM